MGHKIVYQDPVTWEYYYNGKWWDSYPSEEIEADKIALNEYWERKQDQRRDKTDGRSKELDSD